MSNSSNKLNNPQSLYSHNCYIKLIVNNKYKLLNKAQYTEINEGILFKVMLFAM